SRLVGLKGRVSRAARGAGAGMPVKPLDRRGGDGRREARRGRPRPARAAAPRWLLRCTSGALAVAARVAAGPQAFWAAWPRPAAPAAPWACGGRVRLAARGGDEEGEETAPAPAPAPPPPPLAEIRAGDRFTGWLKHPVLTRGDKFSLI
ncbi:unnamed protein product, partial [Prorocentrum cordatum]